MFEKETIVNCYLEKFEKNHTLHHLHRLQQGMDLHRLLRLLLFRTSRKLITLPGMVPCEIYDIAESEEDNYEESGEV